MWRGGDTADVRADGADARVDGVQLADGRVTHATPRLLSVCVRLKTMVPPIALRPKMTTSSLVSGRSSCARGGASSSASESNQAEFCWFSRVGKTLSNDHRCGSNALVRVLWEFRTPSTVPIGLDPAEILSPKPSIQVCCGAAPSIELLLRSGCGSERSLRGAQICARNEEVGRGVTDHVTLAVPLLDCRSGQRYKTPSWPRAPACVVVACVAAVTAQRTSLAWAVVVAVCVAVCVAVVSRCAAAPPLAAARARPAYRAVDFGEDFQLSYFPAQALVVIPQLLAQPARDCGALPPCARATLAAVAAAKEGLRILQLVPGARRRGLREPRAALTAAAPRAAVSRRRASAGRLRQTARRHALVRLRQRSVVSESSARRSPTVLPSVRMSSSSSKTPFPHPFSLGTNAPRARRHPAGGVCRGDALHRRDLRVRGTANLHVVGAAAMPHLPRTNPMATCYALGWWTLIFKQRLFFFLDFTSRLFFESEF